MRHQAMHAVSYYDLIDSSFFRLYNRNGSYIDTNVENVNVLLPYIEKNNSLVLYLTGYTYDINSENVKLITDVYLNYTQDNVLALDYRNITRADYLTAVYAINDLGKLVADALNSIVDKGMNPKKIHIIGHSLGVQLAARIARYVNFVIFRITDPAGPLFYFLDSHLTSSDAKFIDIIHVDMALKTGHVDFFPNYGHRPQPGCAIIAPFQIKKDICTHSRSFEFYAESVKNHTSLIAKCYSLNECGGVEYIPMGYATPSNATGNYYLLTNAESPFGQGLLGATFNPFLIIPIPKIDYF
ncbi:pancreatic lipase-related protein 2 isoform X4 [Apis mellifera]|uniref:phospholipase A1 n=1 Tax=Apis mellifera TaxID=7460 RepID=A0A7M7SQY7_APIME|nr:pancreatic lipase-related protein 2 isoform X4 [Apis mellifera]|eukprot:XP_026299641.1 pancreatic lipase-related protein 2 isoform X4 [Apis mellifera]